MAGEATGRGIERGAKATERGVKRAGEATGKGIKKAGEAIEKTFSGDKLSQVTTATTIICPSILPLLGDRGPR